MWGGYAQFCKLQTVKTEASLAPYTEKCAPYYSAVCVSKIKVNYERMGTRKRLFVACFNVRNLLCQSIPKYSVCVCTYYSLLTKLHRPRKSVLSSVFVSVPTTFCTGELALKAFSRCTAPCFPPFQVFKWAGIHKFLALACEVTYTSL
jgi:hypothetical protein